MNINGNNDHGNPGIIKLLIDAAENLATCNKDIRKNTEGIIRSCRTNGTKGEGRKNMLLAQVDSLNKLVMLNSVTIKKLMNAVSDMEDGIPVEKVLNNVSAYSRFYTDQLKCEERGVRNALNILNEDSGNISQKLPN